MSSRVIDITTTRQHNDLGEFSADLSLYIESLTNFGEQRSYTTSNQIRDVLLDLYMAAIPDMFPGSKVQEMREIVGLLSAHLNETLAQ